MSRNKIINTDCLDYLLVQPSESIDFVLTSPPYDTMRLYKRKVEWSFGKFQSIAVELTRCLKPGSVIVWVVGDETVNHSETGTSFRQALFFKDLGLNLYDTMIFEKANPLPGYRPSMYRQCFEYIFVLCKGEMRIFNPSMEKTTTTRETIYRKANKWSMENGKTTTGEQRRVSVDHPATFPMQLAIDMIYTYTDEGMTVYDPFVGSGTTNLAAYRLNRSAIGTEVVEEYAALAQNRIAAAMAQQQIDFGI